MQINTTYGGGSQGGKERPRHEMKINTTYGGGRTLLSMLEKGYYLFL
jgi:hypothetical protein